MKKKHIKKKNSSIYPLFIVFAVLSVGIISTIIQATQQQNTQSRAQMNFDPNMPPRNCDNTAAELQVSANEKALFDGINAYRRENNLMAVAYSDQLKKAVKWYSKDLAANPNQELNGTDSVGRTLEPRLVQCVVDLSGEFREFLGIAPNAAAALNEFKMNVDVNSDMLSPTADFMAVGNTGDRWVIVMAAPPGSPPNPQRPLPTAIPAAEPTAAPPAAEPTTAPPAAEPTTAPDVPTAAPQEPSAPGAPFPSAACLGSCPTPGIGGVGNDPQPTPCPASAGQGNNNKNINKNINKNESKETSNENRTQFEDNQNISISKTVQKSSSSSNNNGLLAQIIKLLEELLARLGGGTTPPSGTNPQPVNPC